MLKALLVSAILLASATSVAAAPTRPVKWSGEIEMGECLSYGYINQQTPIQLTNNDGWVGSAELSISQVVTVCDLEIDNDIFYYGVLFSDDPDYLCGTKAAGEYKEARKCRAGWVEKKFIDLEAMINQ